MSNYLRYTFLLILFALTGYYFFATSSSQELEIREESIDEKLIPSDYFFAQRALPYNKIDNLAFQKAVDYRKSSTQNYAKKNKEAWQLAGPTNVGGRVTDIEMFVDDLNTIFVGTASGGIFKSSNRGTTWTPIFDNEATLSIGDMAIASDKSIYVGTGEANAGGGSLAYDGVGVYKSTDQGNTWEWKGLAEVGSIGQVVVNPNNPAEVYVAAMGQLFKNNTARGVYKSQDGGDSWKQVLFVSDSTGAIDLAIHPTNPQIVYAAMWERIRRPNNRQYGGATSGIYKSEDGGNSWVELTNDLPRLAAEKGRIGIALAPSNPDIIMAIYADAIGFLEGIYKSEDGGNNWTTISSVSSVSFMWWFGKIFIDPIDSETVFVPALDLHRSKNGGTSFSNVSGSMHVDQHAIYIHPMNTDFVVAGNDGGTYISENGGDTWTKQNTLPITQFYTCEIDYSNPEQLYGGTQDNGTVRTLGGILDDWERISGGDGFRVLVDPSDNKYIYAESQRGVLFRSVDGGQSFSSARTGIVGSDRNNWNSPLAFDPTDTRTLYFGTNKLYKSTNRAVNWSSISPDLTDGAVDGNLTFGTITSIDVSTLDAGIIYIGTDDGNVWNTLNGGDTWTKVSADLPKRWVTDVATDPIDEATAYAIFSGYRFGENIGHIYKTMDNGTTWTDISGNLPDIPLNAIIINPNDMDQLFLASDIGVFETLDGGIDWQLLTANLPNVPVTDLDFHPPTNTLVAASYGRGLYRYELPLLSTATESIPFSKVKANIYPNPTSNILHIDLELMQSTTLSIHISNLMGRNVKTIILQQQMNNGTFQWAEKISDLPSGIYLCRIQTDFGESAFKVMIN